MMRVRNTGGRFKNSGAAPVEMVKGLYIFPGTVYMITPRFCESVIADAISRGENDEEDQFAYNALRSLAGQMVRLIPSKTQGSPCNHCRFKEAYVLCGRSACGCGTREEYVGEIVK